MATLISRTSPVSRRSMLAGPLALAFRPRSARASGFERQTIARVTVDDGLAPPLTLGLARVELSPGAACWAATPDGVRIIVVESGALAVAAAGFGEPITSAELGLASAPPRPDDELFLPAGTAMPFGTLGLASVRNPRGRVAVILDAAVFPEEPRPPRRSFATDDGVSFHLLASASAAAAYAGRLAVSLERLTLGPGVEASPDASRGVAIMSVEDGAVEVRPRAGEVYSARAAHATRYATPGAMKLIGIGRRRRVAAGGAIYLSVDAEARVSNAGERTVELLALAVREADR